MVSGPAFKKQPEPEEREREGLVTKLVEGMLHLASETFRAMGTAMRSNLTGTGYARSISYAEDGVYSFENARKVAYSRTEEHDPAAHFLDIVKKAKNW